MLVHATGYAQVTLVGTGDVGAGGIAVGGSYTIYVSAGLRSPAGLASAAGLTLGVGPLYALTVQAQLPSASHTWVQTHPNGQSMTIAAKLSPGVVRVTLYYRKAGDLSFASVDMTLVGDSARVTIPAAFVTPQGFEYFITVEDGNGSLVRVPASRWFSTQILLAAPGLTSTFTLPVSSYRLVSAPMQLQDGRPSAVFEDDFGGYDNTKWRFFELREDQKYYEYPSVSEIRPGRAYWLILKEGGTFTTGSGLSNLTNTRYSIPLSPGWSFVGNPFMFVLPTSKVALRSGGTVDMRAYGASGWASESTSLTPFAGYAVANRAAIVDTLYLDPDLSAVPVPKMIAPDEIGRMDWAVQIIARCTYATDEDNIAAVNPIASEGIDDLDRPEPPVIGDFVSVYFPHPEWGAVFSKYATDVRPPSKEGQQWEFQVSANVSGKVSLSFESTKDPDDATEVWLVDRILRLNLRLNRHGCYEYFNTDVQTPRRFGLIVGPETYVERTLAKSGASPTSFELSQNFPNPFNPATIIHYGLPTRANVSVKIHNVIGQEMCCLVDCTQDKGYHTVEFRGEHLSSGVYYYRIEARAVDGSAAFSQIRKMILLK